MMRFFLKYIIPALMLSIGVLLFVGMDEGFEPEDAPTSQHHNPNLVEGENDAGWDDAVEWSEIANPEDKPLYWLDENTVLFAGLVNEGVSPKKYVSGAYRLFLWPAGGKAIPVAEQRWTGGENAGTYCAAKGAIYYVGYASRLNEVQRNDIFGGAPGQEERLTEEQFFGPQNTTKAIGGPSLRWGCLPIVDTRMGGRRWYASSAGDFYISLGTYDEIPLHDANVGVTLFDSGSMQTWKFERVDPSAGCVQYFDNLRAFLVWNCTAEPQSDDDFETQISCLSYWVVHTDEPGIVRHCVPSALHDALFSLHLSKLGVLVVSRYLDDRGGIYLIQDGQAEQFLKGLITQPRLSPDGCKLAFNYLRDVRSEAGYSSHLRTPAVLDVCGALKRLTIKQLNR